MSNTNIISDERVKDFGEVYTPYNIINDMLDQFDEDDFSKIWYEPSCGSGRFVVSIAKRMLALGYKPNDIACRILANDILMDNVTTTKSLLIDLIGDHPEIHTNIFQADSLILINSKKIKADIVIGNPPYQYACVKRKGLSGAKAAYPDHTLAVLRNIKPQKFSFIIPSRFLFGTGIGPNVKVLQQYFKTCKKIKQITHFNNPRYPFPEVEIKGGVNYFLFDKNYNSVYCDISSDGVKSRQDLSSQNFVLKPHAQKIVDYIHTKFTKFFKTVCQSNNIFGIETNYKFVEEGPNTLPCFTRRQQYKHVNISDCRNLDLLNKWKLCITRIRSPHVGVEYVFIVPPGHVVSDTYLTLMVGDEQTITNQHKYFQSPIVKFLRNTRHVTPNISPSTFAHVPYIASYNGTDDIGELFCLTPEMLAVIQGS